MIKKQFIFVTFQKEGYHMFPGAETNPEFATGDEYDVSHLGSRHMHYFFFKVWVEVGHSNREIEFIQFRRWLEKLYGAGTLDLNGKSCEMIATDLNNVINERYPGREVRIEVSEDNINGAYLEFTN